MTRILDIFFSFLGLLILFPIIIILFLIGFLDTGSPIFYQERVGRGKKCFRLVKFRSMFIKTQSIATHLANESSITLYGKFLRKSKLDELPQLWNVLVGDMSLVGPRPNLVNQEDVISERDLRNIYSVRPGITGLAQIKKIDMSIPVLLAETDEQMISTFNTLNYFKYILLTISGKGFGDRIKKK
jgi:hypothetical protein